MNKPTEAQEERLRQSDESIGEPNQPVVSVTPVQTPPIVVSTPPPVITAVRPQPKPVNDAQYRAAQFRERCITQWLPRYGNNPNAANDPCMKFKGQTLADTQPSKPRSRLDAALDSVR